MEAKNNETGIKSERSEVSTAFRLFLFLLASLLFSDQSFLFHRENSDESGPSPPHQTVLAFRINAADTRVLLSLQGQQGEQSRLWS